MRHWLLGLVFFLLPLSASAFTISNVNISGQNPYVVSFDVAGSAGQSHLGISNETPNGCGNVFTYTSGTALTTGASCSPAFVFYYPFSGDGNYTVSFTVPSQMTAFYVDLSSDITSETNWYASGDFDESDITGIFDPPQAASTGLYLASAANVFASSTDSTGSTLSYMFAALALILGFLIGPYLINKLISIANKSGKRVLGKRRRM